MNKKLIYPLGGIFLLFLLVIISISSSEPKVSEENINAITTNTAITESVITETKTPEVKTVAQTTSKETSEYKYYSVTEVVDGDTVKINKDGKVETLRLIGLDTPETVDPRKPVQCFGKEASNKAKELLSAKKVRLETDSTQGTYDKYNRTLAYIYLESGLFYNKYMIEQGYAHEYTYNTPYKYQSEFKLAQKSAQDNKRGLWSPNTCNGDTTSKTTPTTPASTTTTIVPVIVPVTNTTNNTQTSGLVYTSSHYTAKYYYPEACDGWKSLSKTYLKSFSSTSALLASYPDRTLSPQCN
jgi:micrococcal nuclease